MAKNSVQEIAAVIAGKHGLSQQDAEAFVSSFFDLINEGLHSEKAVKVKGLGTFKVIDVRERESVNVNTGERVLIESHAKITFTADPVMRDLVNKPFAQFETVVLNDGVELEDMAKVQTPDDSDLKDDGIDDVDSENISDDVDETNSQESNTESFNIINSNYDLPQFEQDRSDNQDCISGKDLEEDTASGNTENSARPISGQNDDKDYSEQNAGGLNDDDIATDSKHVDLVGEDKNEEETGASIICDNEDEVGLQNCVQDSENVLEGEVQTGQTENVETERFANKTIEQFVATGRIDEVHDDSDVQKIHSKSGMAWYYWIFLMFVVAALAFWGGIYWNESNTKPVIKYVTIKQPLASANTSVADTMANNDSVKSADNKLKQNLQDSINVNKNTIEKSEREGNVPTKPSSAAVERADLKNAATAVRTGAYRIVGTDRVVTLKKGETLSKISRFYLGEGMECYIMVHNGTSDIREGMRLKIPKLVSKKK